MKSLRDEIPLRGERRGGFDFIWSRRLKISSELSEDFIVQRTISLTLLGFETLLKDAQNIFFVAFTQKETSPNTFYCIWASPFYFICSFILYPSYADKIRSWRDRRAFYALTYRVILDWPIFLICPDRTILLSTASTVVGLTSGNMAQISALEIGTRLFSTVASILADFMIFLPWTTAKRLSSSL